MEKDKYPFVSFLLVTRNEIDYIDRALMSMINQTYPKECYEIIIVDGESEDGTLERIMEIVKENSKNDFSIRVFDNPRKILASGWNIAIRESKGEYVVRIDAHAEAMPDFLEKSVQTIQKTGAVCVGGKYLTRSVDGDNVVSKVLSSPFGVGNSKFRVSDRPGYSDTVAHGLYRKDIFSEVGFFNENFVRDQDLEMHGRIKKAGGRFYFDPEIQTVYYARNTVKKMVKQAFGNGKWNMILAKKDLSSLAIRHLAPFAFVLFLAAGFAAGFFWHPFWIAEALVLALHLILGFVFSVKKTKDMKQIVQMPFLFMILHISYGAGYFAGLFKKAE